MPAEFIGILGAGRASRVLNLASSLQAVFFFFSLFSSASSSVVLASFYQLLRRLFFLLKLFPALFLLASSSACFSSQAVPPLLFVSSASSSATSSSIAVSPSSYKPLHRSLFFLRRLVFPSFVSSLLVVSMQVLICSHGRELTNQFPSFDVFQHYTSIRQILIILTLIDNTYTYSFFFLKKKNYLIKYL